MFKTITSALDRKKNPSEDEIEKIPSYIFCRWLSGNPHTVLAANQINLYSDIPMVNQYKMVKSVFAGKIKYIPYPKNVSEDKLKRVQFVMSHFKISEEKAKDYIELMSDEELKSIVDMYTQYELKKGIK
jgi:hypothetical protein